MCRVAVVIGPAKVFQSQGPLQHYQVQQFPGSGQPRLPIRVPLHPLLSG